MQIAVLGASAGVGRLTVERGLARGHRLVALSRHLDLPDHPNLLKLTGSATSPADVRQALAGTNVLIVAIGTGNSMKATTLYSETAAVLLQVLPELPAPMPVLVLTGFGTADTPRYQPLFVRLFMKLMLGAVYRDKTRMEQLLTAGLTRWEMVRPGLLTDGPLTTHYRAVTDYYPGMKVGRIARADVAHFLLAQAENPTLLGKYPALFY